MRDRSTKLRHEVEIYGLLEMENELEEKDREEKFIKRAFCEIIPQSNKETITEADTIFNEHNYRFTFRRKSIEDIKKDWFFKHNTNKYQVIYWNDDFVNNEFI